MNFEIAPKETEIHANWNDAKLYCFSINIDGKTGWRLPNREELCEIFNSEHDYKPEWYWSCAAYTGYNAGQQYLYSMVTEKCVRAVRSL